MDVGVGGGVWVYVGCVSGGLRERVGVCVGCVGLRRVCTWGCVACGGCGSMRGAVGAEPSPQGLRGKVALTAHTLPPPRRPRPRPVPVSGSSTQGRGCAPASPAPAGRSRAFGSPCLWVNPVALFGFLRETTTARGGVPVPVREGAPWPRQRTLRGAPPGRSRAVVGAPSLGSLLGWGRGAARAPRRVLSASPAG